MLNMNILTLDSSGDLNGLSRTISNLFLEKLVNTDSDVIVRDLVATPLPFVNFNNNYSNLQNILIQELKEADVIIISAPVYNYSIPAALKAWIDLVCVEGQTFNYVKDIAKGLLENKKVFVIATSNTSYDILTSHGMNDHQSYLRKVLGMIGIANVSFSHYSAKTPEDEAEEIIKANLDIAEINI